MFLIVVIIAVPFYFARKSELTCKKCNCKKVIRTGKTRKIERNRRALIASPLPSKDFEYKCTRCGHVFWNSIEGFYII
jgi:hypothetical protein